jgi:hypothetical protein
MSKKIVVWLIAVAMIMGCLSFASGEEPETTSGGGISVPETPLPPEEPWLPPNQPDTEEPDIPPESVDPENPEMVEPEENALEEEVAQEEALSETDERDILNIVIPSDLNFTIDPLDLAGRGQVYSDAQTIENLGETDVIVSFSDVSVVFANETDFEAVSAPFNAYAGSARKAIYLLLDFGRPDVPAAVLTDKTRTDAPAVFMSAAGSEPNACSLSLSGNVNYGKDADWQDGDVKIRLTYKIETIPKEKEGS